jgi:hypothetical protein
MCRYELPKEAKVAKQNIFPQGWDEECIKRVLHHYENQTDEEALAEDESAWEDKANSFIEVPNELIPAVRNLIARKVVLYSGSSYPPPSMSPYTDKIRLLIA